jgi:hypothetical protein
MTEQQFIETINQFTERLDRLERELKFLRSAGGVRQKKEPTRVYVAEIAEKFGVSIRTVKRMQFDFAGLYPIKKQTPGGRIYFERADYEKWIAGTSGKPKRRGLVRRTKKGT